MSEFITKDSGERRSFDTGAVRDTNNNKGRYDLLSPMIMERYAKLLQRGAIKYQARNWEKGMPLSVYFDSGLRHAFKHLEGWRDEDHLAAILFNFGAVIHIDELIKRGLRPKELDDLPNYLTEETRYG